MIIYLSALGEQKNKVCYSFNYIYEKYKYTVWCKICNEITDEKLREEVLQDVFVKYYRTMGNFSDEDKIRRWLMIVTKTTILDALDKERVYGKHIMLVDDEDIFNYYNNKMVCDPLDDVVKAEIKKEVCKTIKELKPIHSEVVFLVYSMGFTPREAAQRLNIPLDTVYSRLARARSILYNSIKAAMERGEIL